MKIAIIIRRLDVKGGTQRQALSLANELRRRGHGVKLYAIFYSKERCYPDLLENLEVTVLPPEISRSPQYAWMKRLPLLNYLRTFLIIGHETKTARALAFLINDDVDLLNPHDRVAHRVAYFFKKHVKNVPSVWNTNDTHSLRCMVDKLSDTDPKFRQLFWKKIGYALRDWYENKKYISVQDAITTVDQFDRSLIKKYFGREATVIRNGPDLEHFVFKKREIPLRRIRLLTSGIFFPHRRFEDAIEALKLLRSSGFDVELNIIGDQSSDPAYAGKLVQLVRQRELEPYVHFLGRVSEKDLLKHYQEDHIYLYPHHLQSDGLSPFEALASGMPVVVSRSAGAHEVLTDRQNSLLINPKDPKDIARAVRELIENPALYERLSSDGPAFVRANFSWQRYTDGTLTVYGRVLT